MMTGTKSRLFVLSALAATVVAFPASDARADEIAPCDPTIAPYKCAGLAAPSPFTKSLGEDAGFSNEVDTGWIPPDAAADKHGDKNIQVRAQANLKDTKVDVTLTSDWVVRWGPDAAGLAPNSVRIGPRKKAPLGGSMKVTYKLYPNLGLYVNIPGGLFKGEFNFDPFDILKLVKGDKIGLDTDFDYSASCSRNFSLWSYAAPSEPCEVKDDSPDGGTLFKFDPSSLLGTNAQSATKDYVKLEVTLKAGTTAGFTWQTNGITIEGAPAPLGATVDYVDIPYDGSATIAVTAQAKGVIAYKGTTFIVPTVKVEEVAGFPVNLDIPIGAAKAQIPFDSKLPETTIQQKLVFPVPNLNLQKTTATDFGSLEIDTMAAPPKKLVPITVLNAGEGISKGSVSSSNQAIFKVVKKDLDVAGSGQGTIDIEFTPTEAGDFTGEITIINNNINGKDLKIPVKGSATLKKIDEPPPAGGKGGSAGKAGAPPAAGGESGTGGSAGKGGSAPRATDEESTSDGGCGCRVPTSQGEQTPAGVLALLGLAALAFRRKKLARSGWRAESEPTKNGYG